MALDPFAAIEEPAQGADRRVDRDAERIFDSVHAAHLTGNRADAADTGDDVEHLVVPASAQQRFEKAGWRENAQSHCVDGAIANVKLERAFAFDASDVIDLDCLIRHAPRSPYGTPRRPR